MSFSINVTASTKAEAKSKVAAELEAVVARDPSHVADQAAALAAAGAYIDLLPDSDSKTLRVSLSGSLSGTWLDGRVTDLTGAGVSAFASLVEPELQA